ncbi:CaiB/BaiF CoA-transferase family protein [Arenibaculum sp.]|uniref:CaiB/BaiF CoA transferase family protein n=1 Tax=Arenibaculum sp. TaxID=2865862 RepID=UPI002E12CA84|nr:CaiB/BaiF CoA-transferase family protein [Arenibaculum sp.]
MTGPLTGIRVLDMTRVLAGPSATQVLGDLGADVVKVERPGQGDDTRRWGPPWLDDGEASAGGEGAGGESAYFLSANRNKRSLTLDFTSAEGQALARRLAGRADVLVENYKVGTLARYGLGWDQLRADHPGLVYCSITGFGQTGPYAPRAGYDFLVQAMGGIMSLTGEPEGEPQKIGVGIADLMTGMYALVAILAALRHRDLTGVGQHVDMALLDTQVAWLSYAGQYYLTSGEVTPRTGNAHPTIVPYEAFAASDGHVILAVGNDAQYRRFCGFAGRPDLADDPRFATNEARVRNRGVLVPILREVIAGHPRRHWIEGLEKLHVPCSPINRVDQVFADPQVRARGMEIGMPHPGASDPVRLIGSPMKLSETPVSYRAPPPLLGQHTDEVLRDWLELPDAEIGRLRALRVV